MSIRPSLSRREFLASSTRTAAAVGLGAALAGQTAKAATRTIGANDRITLGLIGCGSRGTWISHSALTADNVVCTALCDVGDFRMDETTAKITKQMEDKGHQNIKIDRYEDYRRLLERKDLDAVMIATPDHWHFAPFMAALEAGKHIYIEKPMSYSYLLGMEMVAAAQKHPELTIQIGTQRRSGRQYAKAKEFLDSGKLGKVKLIHAHDTRNWFFGDDPFFRKEKPAGRLDWDLFEQPCKNKHPFDLYRYFTWRWYWDYAGGLVTDVGVHVIDIAQYFMGDAPPKSAVCNGGVYTYDKWETPDTVQAVLDYGTHALSFTSNFTNERMRDGLSLYGTHGTIEILGNDVFIWEEGKRDKPIAQFPAEDDNHQHNWLSCIRSGAKPNAPIELGHSSLLPSHMANLAYRNSKKVTWDVQARKVVM